MFTLLVYIHPEKPQWGLANYVYIFHVYLSPKINNFLLGPVHLTFSTNFEIQLIKKEDFCLGITKHEASDEEFYSSTIKIRV